ncbi:hypothetical protein [Methylocystis echinoides]|uniref:hypothetical protein n=1 Tax=Methylocystis echinoides TaxID=29468 RepID=UPI00343FA265
MRLAFVLLLPAVVIAGLLLLLARDDAPDALVRADVAGVKLAYPRAYARDDATAAGGLADRLAFIASFPAFVPLPATSQGAAPSIVMTVTPKDDSLDPQERPAKLYARFLTPESLVGPGGLVLRRFERASPYDTEELFIAPPEGRSFFARCVRPQIGAPDEGCLSVFRDGGLDVELRYPAGLLEQWDALYEGAHALLARMRAARARAGVR